MAKTIFLMILSFSLQFTFAQDDLKETDLRLYIFESFVDQQTNNGKYVGEYSSYSWSTTVGIGTNSLWINDNSKRIPMKNMWGFKIGDYTFRMGDKPNIPLTVIKMGEKVFYVDGYVYLNYLKGEDLSTTRTTEPIFYSDELNSKIYKIEDIIKNEKENPQLSDLCECINANKKQRNPTAKFNANLKCINDY